MTQTHPIPPTPRQPRAAWALLSPLLRAAVARRSEPDWHDWRWQLQQAAALGRNIAAVLGWTVGHAGFPVRLTPYYASLLDLDALAFDPLAIQALPDARELDPPAADESADPFGEQFEHAPLPGLVHRFPDRLLVRFSASCALYCRHCTRRHLLRPLEASQAGRRARGQRNSPGRPVTVNGCRGPEGPPLQSLMAYIQAHPELREVILSGGDPLLAEDTTLLEAVDRLASLDQIDAVRIGTRVPVVMPMRVSPDLARALGGCCKVWLNTQFNHPGEITPESTAACARLVEAGIPVSNQTVLLRGVNDDPDTLQALFAGLQRIRVRPYYAFLGDPVAGTKHLRTSRAQARRLARAIEPRLGGLALPRFVADLPGAPSKVPIERGIG